MELLLPFLCFVVILAGFASFSFFWFVASVCGGCLGIGIAFCLGGNVNQGMPGSDPAGAFFGIGESGFFCPPLVLLKGWPSCRLRLWH